MIHKTTDVHPCKDCKFVFGNEESLEKHKASLHVKVFTAVDETSAKKMNTLVQMRTLRHACRDCGFVFSADENLKIHMKNIHKKDQVTEFEQNNDPLAILADTDKEVKGRQKKAFTCDSCPYESTTKEYVKNVQK